jgi:nucleotide-binding universal stress UspA family protein
MGIKTEFTQIPGNPGQTIKKIAQNWDADLIVMGSRGRTGLSELVLGSVSNYVMHHAPCSVLIVHS